MASGSKGLAYSRIEPNSRDTTIDCLRGLAIVVMIAANMAGGKLLAEPHPLLFRFYGTFAAPLFIFLAGMMVSRTAVSKGYPLSYFLKRGGMILLIAILIDVCIWHVYPLMGMDVLYLIAVAIPLTALFVRLPLGIRCVLVPVIFLMPSLMYLAVGYRVTVPEPSSLQAALTELGKFSFGRPGFLFFGVSALVLGGVIWFLFPGPLLVRDGYSELFYPPTPGYCLSAIGVISTLFFVVDMPVVKRKLSWLSVYGQCSLLMYVLHVALISYVWMELIDPQPFWMFLRIYLVTTAALWAIAYGVSRLKMRHSNMPFVVKVSLGA